MSGPHPIYPGGPDCQPNCPGPHSMYHDGYADGYERADDWPRPADYAAMTPEEFDADPAVRALDSRLRAQRAADLAEAWYSTALAPVTPWDDQTAEIRSTWTEHARRALAILEALASPDAPSWRRASRALIEDGDDGPNDWPPTRENPDE